MMAKPWNEHRETITKLYIQEGRTLEDVRGIMKSEYNFEASIRSYRQHFDTWDIGKYNCKKRQQRRRRESVKRAILPCPPPPAAAGSPPGLTSSSSETTSNSGSSPTSSCHRPPEQLPLPALHLQHPRYPAAYLDQLPRPEPPRIKTEGGGTTTASSWREMPMYPNTAPSQNVLQSNAHFPYADSASWSVQRTHPPAPPMLPPSSFLSHSPEYCRPSSYRCVPETAALTRHCEMASGLRAPNLSFVRGNGGHGALHPPVSHPVSFHQGVASG